MTTESTTRRIRTETFSDWVDLQTRLVLLPHVEEEGIGAVVASHAPSDGSDDDHPNNILATDKTNDKSLIGWILTGIMDTDASSTAPAAADDCSGWKDQEFSEILAALRRADPPMTLRFEAPASTTFTRTSMMAAAVNKDATYNHHLLPFEEEKKMEEEPSSTASEDSSLYYAAVPPSVVVPTGMVVPNSNSNSSNDHERSTTTTPTSSSMDIHEDQPSVVPASEEEPNLAGPTDNDVAESAPAPEESRPDANDVSVVPPSSPTRSNNNNNNTAPSSSSSFNLSLWTLRVSAAANSAAAVMARAAAKQVATAERSSGSTNSETETSNNNQLAAPEFQIFVQSPTGAFLPLAAPKDPNSSATTPSSSSSTSNTTIITNTSLLVVRRSTTQPVDAACHSFQWHRSSSSNNAFWEALPNATLSALQPSATEVGYRLRCVITRRVAVERTDLERTDPINDDENSTRGGGGDDHSSTTTICETSQSVRADVPLLNGARQALVRGAQFGNLQGRGTAEGRVFSVTIQMGSSNSNTNTSSAGTRQRRHKILGAVTLYQVAGGASELIHPHPLVNVTASSDYGHGKNLELVFSPSTLLPPDSMVAALCTTRDRFQLQAPNRAARESILLALGVANHRGPPAELNASTILYHPLSDEEDSSSSDGQSVRSASSVDTLGLSSLESSSRSRRDSTLPVDRAPVPQQQQQDMLRRSSNSFSSTLHERCLSGDSSLAVDPFFDSSDTVASQELELELERLRAKLARKDKVVSELQRQLAASDEQCRQTAQQCQVATEALDQSRTDHQTTQQALRKAQSQLQAAQLAQQEQTQEWHKTTQTFECERNAQNQTIAALGKAQRTLQNEKDLLTAAVEARDSKLAKMEALQASLDRAMEKLQRTEEFENELDVSNQKMAVAQAEIDRVRESESTGQLALEQAQAQIVTLQQQLQLEQAQTASHQSELEKEQMKIQKLKAERNSYKQKGDSLAKEMARVCRHGRTIREVEKILADDVTRREEVALLREQKRQALEQAEHFRTAYEQSLSVQKLAGLDHDVGKLLERNAELERLLSELTEYLNAREMQLETLKQVNEALQSEIRGLAKASMSDHDV